MRKREVLVGRAFRFSHMHVHKDTFICVDTFTRSYINLCTVMPTCTHLECTHMLTTFTLSVSFILCYTHTYTHRCAHSHCRRGVNAVGTWFPSLHTHSSLRRRPDRTLCPTGHGSTHTHTSIHTCHYTVTHMHR